MCTALRSLAFLMVLPLGLFAQQSNKPSFSGIWKLDLVRSRYGDVPEPKSLVIQIEHHEPVVRVLSMTSTDKGEQREVLELTTDGRQYTLVKSGPLCVATANWDRWTGTRLVVEVSCPGVSRSRRFTLGTRGRTLTTILTLSDRAGQKKAYEFFFRQGT